MKLKLNLKNKEASFEADIEKLVDKRLDFRNKHPERKTSYQIRQEEKRKNEELKHKQEMQKLMIGIICFAVIFGVCLVMSILE